MATIEREVDKIELTTLKTETPILSVTPLAVKTVKGLLEEKGLINQGLRVFVSGGGCSGMQYGMQFEENLQPFDEIVEVDGIKFIVDSTSLQHIRGATIDYIDNLMGGGFRIDNPQAVSACGCGTSFRTSGSAESDAHAHGAGCGAC